MNPHFVEMLKALRDEGVEHLVIGAHALAAHGYVRATLDIDIWVRPSAEKPRPNPRVRLLRDARRDLLAAARGFGLVTVSDARCAGGPDGAPRPSYVAIEGDQDPVLEPAHGDQILVGRLAGDDGGLDHVVSPFQEPLGDGAIDVLIGEESHLQAADWGTSTTSSVESMAAA